MSDDPFELNDTNIKYKKIQLYKEPVELLTFQERPIYIISALRNRDESFYLKGKDDNIFKRTDPKDYPIFKYSTCCFKYINTYLRNKTMYEYDENHDWFGRRYYTFDDLRSWTWCLHKELCTRYSNVQNGTLIYRGVRNATLPSYFKVGYTFCFAEFISTSTNINISLSFLKDSSIKDDDPKILFYITIF